jgi:ion channel-forming bestrophin family protein
MITYDPKGWLPLTVAYRGTIIPRVLARVGILAAITLAVVLSREFIPAAESFFKHFKPLGHVLIGVALGLLIVFRNNCSYDRYWEGRKLWGAIVNSSRNLVREAAAFAGGAAELARLVTAYPLALKQHLRGSKDLEEVRPLLAPAAFDHASAAGNPPSVIAYYMTAWIRDRLTAGTIDSVTARMLEDHVRTLLECQGGCERILRTPIPFAYAVHIKQLLMLYLVTLPFILVGDLGWVALPTVAVIAFGLLGIEEAGVEIEDPFGDDPNDLPLEAICATVGRDAQSLADAPKLAGS